MLSMLSMLSAKYVSINFFNMSNFTIKIHIEEYLKQWFINDCGTSEPITLKPGSIESKVLETFLKRQPYNQPAETVGESICIYIPTFKYKNAEIYNYLPSNAQKIFVSCIRNRFDIDLFTTLYKFENIHVDIQDLIRAFMEHHNIADNDKNFNSILKRYQRLRLLYKDRERKKKI